MGHREVECCGIGQILGLDCGCGSSITVVATAAGWPFSLVVGESLTIQGKLLWSKYSVLHRSLFVCVFVGFLADVSAQLGYGKMKQWMEQ